MSSWQSVVDSVTAIDHAEHPNKDNATDPSNHPSIHVVDDGRLTLHELGMSDHPSRARRSGFLQYRKAYHIQDTWNQPAMPLPEPSYFPTSNDICHDNQSQNHSQHHSRTTSHSLSKLPVESSYIHSAEYSSSTTPQGNPSSAFMPITRGNSEAGLLQHTYDGRLAPSRVLPSQFNGFSYGVANDFTAKGIGI